MVPPQVLPIKELLDTDSVRLVSQLSPAVPPRARNWTRLVAAGGTLLRHWTEMFCGHVMEGGKVSRTVIVCVQLAELVQASVRV
jgi:hypothetical protein